MVLLERATLVLAPADGSGSLLSSGSMMGALWVPVPVPCFLLGSDEGCPQLSPHPSSAVGPCLWAGLGDHQGQPLL